MWLEVAIVATLFAVGNVLFGHFEERTPRWRRVLKILVVLGITALVARTAGRPWSFLFIALLVAAPLVIHGWWLPRHGINGWTGEPKARYWALRGWGEPPAGSSGA